MSQALVPMLGIWYLNLTLIIKYKTMLCVGKSREQSRRGEREYGGLHFQLRDSGKVLLSEDLKEGK